MMQYIMIGIAAAALLIAVLLLYEIRQLSRLRYRRQENQKEQEDKAVQLSVQEEAVVQNEKPEFPEEPEEITEALPVIENENTRIEQMNKLQDSLFGVQGDIRPQTFRMEYSDSIRRILDSEQEAAERKQEENEKLFPSIYERRPADIMPDLFISDDVNVDLRVDAMMNEIMRSIDLEETIQLAMVDLEGESDDPGEELQRFIDEVNQAAGETVAQDNPISQEEVDSLIAENCPEPSEEETPVMAKSELSLELLESIDDINRAAEEYEKANETAEPVMAEASEETAEIEAAAEEAITEAETIAVEEPEAVEEDVTAEEEAVIAESAAAEESEVSAVEESEENVITEDAETIAETAEETVELETSAPVAEEVPAAEPVKEEESEAPAEPVCDTLKYVFMQHSRFGYWNGKYGTGEPVLFVFRNSAFYAAFIDTVKRMDETGLYPSFEFYFALVSERSVEDKAVDEISSWFFEEHRQVSRILIDTADRYRSKYTRYIGIGTGTMMEIKVSETSELGKADLEQLMTKLKENGVICSFENSVITVMAADNELAEAVLEDIEEIGRHYDFRTELISQQNASDVAEEFSMFVTSIKNAAQHTFRGRIIDTVVLPASEWQGSLRGYEACWFMPDSNRAVSFYMNLLCLG